MPTPETQVYYLSRTLGLRIVDLKHVRVDPGALRLLSEAEAQEHSVLPLGFDGDGSLRVAVGIKNQDSYAGLLAKLSKSVGCSVRFVLAMDGNVDEQLITSAYFDLDPTA